MKLQKLGHPKPQVPEAWRLEAWGEPEIEAIFFSKMLVSASEKSTFSNMLGQCWTYFLESWVVEGHILSKILSSFSQNDQSEKFLWHRKIRKMLPSSRVEDSQMNQQRLEAQNIINWSQNIRKAPNMGDFPWNMGFSHYLEYHPMDRNWSATGASSPTYKRDKTPKPGAGTAVIGSATSLLWSGGRAGNFQGRNIGIIW